MGIDYYDIIFAENFRSAVAAVANETSEPNLLTTFPMTCRNTVGISDFFEAQVISMNIHAFARAGH